MYNYPVVYVDEKRVRRGYYTLEAQPLITDDHQAFPMEKPHQEVLQKNLEEAILNYLGSWLWSHKRWKLSL